MTTLPIRAISTERLQVIVATLVRTSPDPQDPFITEAIRRGLITPLVDLAPPPPRLLDSPVVKDGAL